MAMQTQTFYGLVEQNGPWKLTRKDKQRLREKDPLWLGGGNPAGGRAHAGHASWLVSTGYPHRSDGYSKQAEIKNYPKADTGPAYQSLVSYQSDHRNRALFQQGVFGVPPGGSPFLKGPTPRQFGPAGTMQPPQGYFPITGLAPGSAPTAPAPTARGPPQLPEQVQPGGQVEPGVTTNAEFDDIFNDSDPRPTVDTGVQTDMRINSIDTGVVMSTQTDNIPEVDRYAEGLATTAITQALMETQAPSPAEMFPGRELQMDMMAEGLTTTAIRQALRELPPLANNAQVDARTAPRSFVDTITQTTDDRRTMRMGTQTSPTQTVIDVLVNTGTVSASTSPLPVPSVVSNGVQTDALQGLTLGDRVMVYESLPTQVARLEAQAQTSPVTVLTPAEQAAIQERYNRDLGVAERIGLDVGMREGLSQGQYEGYQQGFAAGQTPLNPPVYTEARGVQTSPTNAPAYTEGRGVQTSPIGNPPSYPLSISTQTENPTLRAIGTITEAEGVGQGQAAALAQQTVARQLQIASTRRGSAPTEMQSFIEPTVEGGMAMVPNPRRVEGYRSAATPVTGEPSRTAPRGRVKIQVGGAAERTARKKGARQPGVNRPGPVAPPRRRGSTGTMPPALQVPTTRRRRSSASSPGGQSPPSRPRNA